MLLRNVSSQFFIVKCFKKPLLFRKWIKTVTGKIKSTLEPQQLLRIGGKNDPFEKPLRTARLDQYGKLVYTNTRGRFYDFRLDGDGQIIPEWSHGKRD